MMKALLLIFTSLFCTFADACIWTSKSTLFEDPFYPSNNIEVCFRRPEGREVFGFENPADDKYRREYENKMSIIQRTVQKQINEQTAFELVGFTYCDMSQENQNKRIIIDMNNTETGAMSNIGPIFNEQEDTIDMGILAGQNIKNAAPEVISGEVKLPAELRNFSQKSFTSFTALHEIMHAIGFQHNDAWDSIPAAADAMEVAQFGENADEVSIMNPIGQKSFDEEGLSMLSQRDVQCLNLVASREILNQNVRAIERPSRENNSQNSLGPTNTITK